VVKFTLATDTSGNEQGTILLNLKNGVLAYYDKDKNIAQDSPNRSLNLISGVVNNFTIAGGTW
jgi:hypothetical protein